MDSKSHSASIWNAAISKCFKNCLEDSTKSTEVFQNNSIQCSEKVVHHIPDKRSNEDPEEDNLLQHEKDPYYVISRSLENWQSKQKTATTSYNLPDKSQARGLTNKQPSGKQSQIVSSHGRQTQGGPSTKHNCDNQRVQYCPNPVKHQTDDKKGQSGINQLRQPRRHNQEHQSSANTCHKYPKPDVQNRPFNQNQSERVRYQRQFRNTQSTQPNFNNYRSQSSNYPKQTLKHQEINTNPSKQVNQNKEPINQQKKNRASNSLNSKQTGLRQSKLQQKAPKPKLTEEQWEKMIAGAVCFKMKKLSLPIGTFDGAGVNPWPDDSKVEHNDTLKHRKLSSPINTFDGAGVNPWPNEHKLENYGSLSKGKLSTSNTFACSEETELKYNTVSKNKNNSLPINAFNSAGNIPRFGERKLEHDCALKDEKLSLPVNTFDGASVNPWPKEIVHHLSGASNTSQVAAPTNTFKVCIESNKLSQKIHAPSNVVSKIEKNGQGRLCQPAENTHLPEGKPPFTLVRLLKGEGRFPQEKEYCNKSNA